jgi:hypothetical protein
MLLQSLAPLLAVSAARDPERAPALDAEARAPGVGPGVEVDVDGEALADDGFKIPANAGGTPVAAALDWPSCEGDTGLATLSGDA